MTALIMDDDALEAIRKLERRREAEQAACKGISTKALEAGVIEMLIECALGYVAFGKERDAQITIEALLNRKEKCNDIT